MKIDFPLALGQTVYRKFVEEKSPGVVIGIEISLGGSTMFRISWPDGTKSWEFFDTLTEEHEPAYWLGEKGDPDGN